VLGVITQSLFLPWKPQFSTKQAKIQNLTVFCLYLHLKKNLISLYPMVLCVITKTLFLPWESQFSTKWAKIVNITFFVFSFIF
jgi:hypothetical protein